jgi:hypothetical protein
MKLRYDIYYTQKYPETCIAQFNNKKIVNAQFDPLKVRRDQRTQIPISIVKNANELRFKVKDESLKKDNTT